MHSMQHKAAKALCDAAFNCSALLCAGGRGRMVCRRRRHHGHALRLCAPRSCLWPAACEEAEAPGCDAARRFADALDSARGGCHSSSCNSSAIVRVDCNVSGIVSNARAGTRPITVVVLRVNAAEESHELVGRC